MTDLMAALRLCFAIGKRPFVKSLDARPAFRALQRNTVLDALDPVPLDSLDFSERLSDPEAESPGSQLEEELQHTLVDSLERNLLDSIMDSVEEQICHQNRSCGYDECVNCRTSCCSSSLI
jgi:hypothetical protein